MITSPEELQVFEENLVGLFMDAGKLDKAATHRAYRGNSTHDRNAAAKTIATR